MYQAFYRAYRPQTFGEMSGQQHVRRTLQNALLQDKTTHAYLFSGPRGTGKTSTAKIFAKALNCVKAPTDEPCNECDSCRGITDGSDTDVIEFDAASNSRVEEIREIIEKVRFAPSHSRFKVYIIDEVHMLSNSAFNALLKTLEEPPAHVVFILATTEPHKLPPTIISRCQRFDFKPLSRADLKDRMEQVLDDSGIPYEEPALKVIAQAAAGGMRDALSMLDQAVSFGGDDVTADDAVMVTGSIGEELFREIAEALSGKDAAAALSLLERLVSEGKDVVRLTEDLITFFRDLLVMKAAPGMPDLLEIISEPDGFMPLSESLPEGRLYAFISILSETQQEMRFSNHAKVYLEAAFLRMIQADGTPVSAAGPASAGAGGEVEELQRQVSRLEQTVSDLTRRLQQGIPAAAESPSPERRRPAPKSKNGFQVQEGRIRDVLANATKEDIRSIKSNWASILSDMQKSQAALLNDAEPVAASDKAFVLKFKYAIHCGMAASNPEFLASLSQGLSARAGKAYDVVFVPEEDWLKIREAFIRENGLQKPSSGENRQEPGNPDEEAAEEALAFLEEAGAPVQDPLVGEAEKLFGKEAVNVYDD
ncbi:DNA polymerase III subunit tau [Bhargavaea cecembensis DSE10]|uniref:DNA-directed DNA polymerase n=1 Tax=Bhargavaea cecembensis DSE10 TaxID=1235279 RepID=M7NCK5_9BACL|nr:DNA polymerase III subunit gamma/tau [Bhargavaea cecembensis]EMR04906.1 DNA polymerase III subunit tau [Bhargavaea cecembensis DSE10]